MENKPNDDVEKFLTEVGKYNFWKSLDIKLVAAKLDGKWTSRVTKILLIPEGNGSSEKLIYVSSVKELNAMKTVLVL